MSKRYYIRSKHSGEYWKRRRAGLTKDIEKAFIYKEEDIDGETNEAIEMGTVELIPVEDVNKETTMVEKDTGVFDGLSDAELVILYQVLNCPAGDSLQFLGEQVASKVCRLADRYKTALFKKVKAVCEARGIDPYNCTVNCTATVMRPVEEIVTKDIE